MKYTIIIDEIPPSLNKVVFMAKRHWALYSSVKKAWKKKINSLINPNWASFSTKVDIEILLCFEDKRVRDPDNYMVASKFVLDALTKKENPDRFLIYDDSENWINKVAVSLVKGKRKRMTVVIKSVRDEISKIL